MTLSRRNLFTGGAALLAAPSIVRVASLMPVRVRRFSLDDLVTATLRANMPKVAESVARNNALLAHMLKVREMLDAQSVPLAGRMIWTGGEMIAV